MSFDAVSLAPAVTQVAPEDHSGTFSIDGEEQATTVPDPAVASTGNPRVVDDPILDAASDLEELSASSLVSEGLRRAPAA